MPTPALLLLLATLLPLLSFGILFFLGNRMGNPLSGWVATGFIALSFGLSMAAMIAWYNNGQLEGFSWGPGDKPIDYPIRWLEVVTSNPRAASVDFELYVDSLTIALFNTITLVLLLIHVFALGFLTDQSRFWRFFTRYSLVSFSILGFVLSGNLFQLMLFWLFLQIAAWPSKRRKPGAMESRWPAILAFCINCLGDFGFFAGMVIFFRAAGNISLLQLVQQVAPAMAGGFPLDNGIVLTSRSLTLGGIAFLWGALCKSCQLPLRSCLAESSATPSPAGAIFQSIPYCASALYLIARFFPCLTPEAKLFIAVVGLVSLFTFSLLAMFQNNIRVILAFSIMAQSGLVLMAFGLGSWAGGIFQFITHAFYGTLLLLAAGSITRAARGRTNLRDFGGWFSQMPVTACTFAVAILAMCAFPYTSGYYSIRMVAVHAGAFGASAVSRQRSELAWVFFVGITLSIIMTAFYTSRCWMRIFLGTPRNIALHHEARERTSLWFPLLALSVVALVGGSRVLDIKHFITDSVEETENYRDAVSGPDASSIPDVFSQAWPIQLDRGSHAAVEAINTADRAFSHFVYWAFLLGIAPAVMLYGRVAMSDSPILETDPAITQRV